MPAAQAEVIPREDVGSSNEAASPIQREWDAAEICRVLYKMANAPQDVGPTDNVPEEIQLEVHEYMMRWDEYLAQYHKAIQNETFYNEAKSQDDDEDSQKFFDQKIAEAIVTQTEAQGNSI